VGHPWLRFALRRALVLVASLVVLVTATFVAVHLVPGDPARAGLGPTAPASQIEARRALLRLDEPVLVQYKDYVGGLFDGDLRRSFVSGQRVAEIIGDRFPATAKLAGLAFLVTLLIGVPLGAATAVLTRGGRGRGLEAAFSFGTGLVISIPDYLCAVGLVALFGVTLQWLPIASDASSQAYVLPVLALAALPTGVLARIARIETLKVLDQEYMRVARSKRLPARLLYLRHALPNTLTATLTLGGLMLGSLVAGTVIIENVFAWPGLGSAITQAIEQKDYPLVQGIVLVLGGIALFVNLVVDVLLGVLDPRSLIRES
jgi:peptide/nickel transport system permease protein